MYPPTSPLLGALLACMLLTGCGSSDPGDASAEAPLPGENDPPPREGELLLASPPEGWTEAGAVQTPALRMAEYGPPQETEGELERITFEAQGGDPLPDPIDFVLAVSRDLKARCERFEDINVSSGYENGYPTSVRLMICPEFKDSPHGQVVLAKAIQGNEKFYVITRRLRVPRAEGQGQPLTAQEMAQWTTHVKQVQVCDTRSGEHPCPEHITSPDQAGTSAPAETPGQNAATVP